MSEFMTPEKTDTKKGERYEIGVVKAAVALLVLGGVFGFLVNYGGGNNGDGVFYFFGFVALVVLVIGLLLKK